MPGLGHEPRTLSCKVDVLTTTLPVPLDAARSYIIIREVTSLDHLFPSFIALFENEYFWISNLHCFFTNITSCALVHLSFLTLGVTTGPNSARMNSAKSIPADFGITL